MTSGAKARGGRGTKVVTFIARDGKAIITIARPEAMNAINEAVGRGLLAAIERFAGDDTLRVAILTGAGGRAFSAGGDLKEAAGREADIAPLRAGSPRIRDRRVYDPGLATGAVVIQALDHCAKPIIAAVDGFCLAAGFECALACDIRVATRGSKFGMPEPTRGRLGSFGLIQLSRLIPRGEALRYQLTGAQLSAERAHQIGLVQEVAEDREGLMAAVERIADEIIRCSPLAVEYIKQIVKTGADLPADQAMRYSEMFTAAIRQSGETLAAAKEFAGSRKVRK